MVFLAWLSLCLPFVTGVMVASPLGMCIPCVLPGFEPRREGGGAPYWMPVLCGVLRTHGTIGGQESDRWDHLERRAHALRQEVDSSDGDDCCSLLASDRLFLRDDAGTVHHREQGYQYDRPSEAAAGLHRPQGIERL